MSDSTIQQFAETFLRIFEELHPGQSPSHSIQQLSLADAYRVQQAVIALRIGNGERVVGYKVGCTSRAIRDQFRLTQPICGRLIEPHVYFGDQTLQCADFSNCALEPEFVFCIGKEIRDDQLDDASLLQAIDHVSPGLEVHNYRFWFGDPSSQELIASNGIHACLVVGDNKVKAKEINLNGAEVALLVNHKLMVNGKGEEIMDGGPLLSLRWLIGHLAERGEYLRPGSLVIPGSPVKLISVGPGDIAQARISGVGYVEARFV
jgi:2-keto-4-pentenoate hydratase